MSNETAYIVTHHCISPEADLFADVDALRDYLAERHEEDPEAGWDQIIDTLDYDERTIYADVGNGLGLVEVARRVRTTTVDGAMTDDCREDIAATVEELEALPALKCPVTIEGTDPDWPYLIVVDEARRQPINAEQALDEARAYLEPAK